MIEDNGRIYTHYKIWEDWKSGMFSKQAESRERIAKSLSVLGNPDVCKVAMEKVIKEWPVSTAVNLSIPGCQRPWLGRAARCIYFGIAENITRIAWWQLSIEEQNKANEIADNIINIWRKHHQINQMDLFNG